MKILAIMGSPNKKGNTYELTRNVEEKMKQLDDVEFEYVFLKDLDLKSCLGCGVCFDKGEELCPLKDDRAVLEEKMKNADGVVFTSPNYVFNVSGLMKNFIDRFGYVCHRPRFFKSAMILTTSGAGVGTNLMLKPFSLALKTWGFNVVSSLDIITNGDPNSNLSTPVEKVNKKVNNITKKFYNTVTAGRPKPSILNMGLFLFTKQNIKNVHPELFDFRYYNDHKWLDKDVYYYYDPEANVLKKSLASLLSRFINLVV